MSRETRDDRYRTLAEVHRRYYRLGGGIIITDVGPALTVHEILAYVRQEAGKLIIVQVSEETTVS